MRDVVVLATDEKNASRDTTAATIQLAANDFLTVGVLFPFGRFYDFYRATTF